MFLFLFSLLCFFGIELAYFRIANRYNIIDKPNSRSSHALIAIRGGGIIFPIAFLLPTFISTFTGWSFIVFGLLAISSVSFLDDIQNLNNRVRLVVQSIAVILLLLQAQFNLDILLQLLLFIIVTGIINAYNFMDGINGITSLYSLVTISSLFWINHYVSSLLPDIFFISLLGALSVFSFFNVRTKAKCFAGDVGSVSIAFIICFLLLHLIRQTGFVYWILFLGLYGIDTVFTIVCRILRKEPLMQAHRSHFYQYLANEAGLGHILVSSLYAGVQIILNLAVIQSFRTGNPMLAVITLFVFLLIYIIFRLRFEGRYRLFTRYEP